MGASLRFTWLEQMHRVTNYYPRNDFRINPKWQLESIVNFEIT